MHKVWIVDDDSSIRWVLARALRAEQFDVRDFEDAEQALHAWSDMDDAMLLGLLDEQVPMDRIGETLMRSRASLAERVLVLIEEGFLSVEVLM